jgi:hypothetical protein
MLKFTLLFAFVFVCVQWLYHPVEYHPSEEMINQYRPSMKTKKNDDSDSLKVATLAVSPGDLRFLIAYE